MRIAYIDIDAHHGDGVQWAFYDRKEVLTVSLHERGDCLFPGTGWTEEIGEGEGRGFSVNLPLPPGTDDELYYRAFMELIPPLIERFRPDVLVTQLGIDTLRSDPLTHLALSLQGFGRIVREIKALSIPWVALGGGGYDVEKVAKGWTTALAIMANEEIPEKVPSSICTSLDLKDGSMVDEPIPLSKDEEEKLWREIGAELKRLKGLIPWL